MDKYYRFLDDLRESGVTNMFGAVPFLMERFPDLKREEARRILVSWMDHKTSERYGDAEQQ